MELANGFAFDAPMMTTKRSKKTTHGRNYVREWRLYRGLNQESLGELADLSASSISQLETGVQGYEESTLIKLAAALECHPSDLLFGPPDTADLLGDLRTLPEDRREEIVKALRDMLASLKRLGKIA